MCQTETNSKALKAVLDASEDFVENWDGAGASSLAKKSLEGACKFVRHLPLDVPIPEVSAMPDGCMTLDWGNAESLLTLKFLHTGGYVYAFNSRTKQYSGAVENYEITPVLEYIRKFALK